MKVGLGHDEGPATRCVTGPSGFEASAADGLSPQPTVVLATSHIRTARIARAREHPRPLSPASSAPHKSSDREAEVGHASRPTADHSRPSLDPPQSPRPSLIFFAPVDGAVHRCSVVTETCPFHADAACCGAPAATAQGRRQCQQRTTSPQQSRRREPRQSRTPRRCPRRSLRSICPRGLWSLRHLPGVQTLGLIPGVRPEGARSRTSECTHRHPEAGSGPREAIGGLTPPLPLSGQFRSSLLWLGLLCWVRRYC